MKSKIMLMLSLALIIGACSSNNDVVGPTPIEVDSEEQVQGASYSTSSVDPLLKKKVSFSIEGEDVVATLVMPYNQDLGNVILLAFDRGGNPQRFISASAPLYVKGPQGSTFVIRTRIGKGDCNRPIQADLILADRLLPRHQQNNIFPQELIDADTNLASEDCPERKPRPDPSPTPCPEIIGAEEVDPCAPPPVDQCLNIEGFQSEVPVDEASGLPYTQVFDEVAGGFLCTPPSTTEICTALAGQAPEITGSLGAVVGDMSVSFGQGTILPLGGTFDPALASVDRPAYGESAVMFNTLYTVTFGPEGICSTSKGFSFQVEPKAPTCEQANPPQGVLGQLSFPPFTPAMYFYDGDSSFANDCADDGGTFFANIDGRQNVCRTANNHGSEWDYNQSNDDDNSDDEADRYKTQAASGGNPISGSATISNAGVWRLVLVAQNPGFYEKKEQQKTLTCGQQDTLNVSYPWVGHNAEEWYLQLFHNGVLIQNGPVTFSPVN